MSHDPRKEAEKLREQLASHDKPLVFLAGAGTSASVRVDDGAGGTKPLVPPVAPLTEICVERVRALGGGPEAAIDQIAADAAPLGRAANIEDILSLVRRMIDAVGEGELAGLDRDGLALVETTIRTTIGEHANPARELIPAETPHDRFARWAGTIPRRIALELFTTNYDILFERSLERASVPVFDGFVGSYEPYFDAACLDRPALAPGSDWARVWKVHGSVNWRWASATDRRIIRGAPSDDGELILPSQHKYDESRRLPYVALLDHLDAALRRDGAILICIGFSFGDQHINEIVFQALDNRRLTHVVALQFDELPDTHDLILAARRRRNLLVYGPDTAVISGERARWRLLQPVDDAVAPLVDPAFDSDADPASLGGGVTGLWRLGNFSWFCAFLEALT